MSQEIREIKYVLHIQNPFNMNAFDDYESDRPFAPFAVGDEIAPQTFTWGASRRAEGRARDIAKVVLQCSPSRG